MSGSGLVPGQQFELRDVQDYFGSPVFTGTYNGSNITINVAALTAVSEILGLKDPANVDALTAPTHTDKEFNAFVVIPR